MLSFKALKSKDIAETVKYYSDSLDDYYIKEGDASKWQGRGAKALSLKGAVDSEVFHKLLLGDIAGVTGAKIASTRSSTRIGNNQRLGIDFTFSAPKSISIQALIGLDKNIITAHDKAVKRALEIAELKAETRKKVNGKSRVEQTKNLIIANFRHETSRERDPQLHSHCILMNLTQREDGKWCSLKNDEIMKMIKYLGAVYRSELAIELQKMGYALRFEKKGFFELAHITNEQIDRFSKRSTQIEELLAKQGLNRSTATISQKQVAALSSRKSKTKESRLEIMREWRDLSTSLGINFDYKAAHLGARSELGDKNNLSQNKRLLKTHLKKDARLKAAKRAVKFAINHLKEREAILEHRELLKIASQQAVGAAKLHDIKQQIENCIKSGYLIKEEVSYMPANETLNAADLSQKINVRSKNDWINELIIRGKTKQFATNYVANSIKQGRLIKLEARYTTSSSIKSEKNILKIEHKGKSALQPILSNEDAEQYLKNLNLNESQARAASVILTSRSLITGVQGYAGTGKNHMLKSAKQIIENQGYRIKALAPYGSQAKALKNSGFEASTVTAFLHSRTKNIDDKAVIIVDEAGVLPTDQLEKLLKLAKKYNTRVILLGDIAQTKAIEAGKPFDQLQKAGMELATMDQIKRQKEARLKKAVEFADKGDLAASLKLITNIKQIKDKTERLDAIISDYMNLSKSDRDETLVVSGTNEARQYINSQIRLNLKNIGEIEDKDTKMGALVIKDVTKEERKHCHSYQVGDIIIPEINYPKIGLEAGQEYTVISKSSDGRSSITVKHISKKIIEFNPAKYSKQRIFKLEHRNFAVGDLVKITQSNSKLGLVNGDRMRVKEISVLKGYMLLVEENEKATKICENINIQSNTKTSTNESTEKSKAKKIKLPLSSHKHLDYAYATTVHSSQGLTANRTLIDLNTKSLTTDKEIYYVAISRAKHEVQIYTNSIFELPQAIARRKVKSAALELKGLNHDYNRE